MIFRPTLAAAVMAGEKTVTRRVANQRPRSPWYAGARSLVGRRVAVQPGRGQHAIGTVEVIEHFLGGLGHLDAAEARAEGFASVAEFEATFAALNGTYDPHVLVWVVRFTDPQPVARG
ncbi:hypothetical protein PAI11_35820 [Patulibacter medicamentivorans]|uniref:ASCH domain-containing protein n=1 Tax=Patulibacter medicamentivorans TaxID=1097667 RepID=H0E9R2_9ACTN|nr:ASCH domain-containing protein [Patulibacter medicamentivorans]EHN09606.1 hypothetical protein PAI11_35820 [Patulibacter medicamentivorans]